MKVVVEHLDGLKWCFECAVNSSHLYNLQQAFRSLEQQQSLLASAQRAPKVNSLDSIHSLPSQIPSNIVTSIRSAGAAVPKTLYQHAIVSDTNMLNIIDPATATVLFACFFVFRYLRLFVSIFTYTTYKPYPIAENPRYRPEDTTVVVPTTFKTPDELVKCLRCILDCKPAAILVVTAEANVHLVRDLCYLNSFFSALNNFSEDRKTNIEILGIEKLNKRNQMIKALKKVDTDIVVFADDDVFWPAEYLENLLAIFENPSVGAGGSRQRVRRNSSPNLWNFLGIAYLERRVWNNIATNAIDGSVSTLSGRSAAYLTKILKNEEFFEYFTNDSWLGRPLNTDDDKCLTRYVYSHSWEIAIQTAVCLETTLEDNPKYIQQCLRWARAHWRGNFTVMTNESYWRSLKYWWGSYYIYVGQFQTPAILVDGLLMLLLANAVSSSTHAVQVYSIGSFMCWVTLTKIVKLVPHFCRYPQDIVFLPVSLAFSYLHGIINVYALCTLTHTAWGSQDLEKLAESKATNDEIVPLLKHTMEEIGGPEPTPGRMMEGDDYFSVTCVRPSIERTHSVSMQGTSTDSVESVGSVH